MNISNAGIALIKQCEGFSATPYRCPANIWTVGYGHVMHADEWHQLQHVEPARAEQLLVQDTASAAHAVARLIAVPLRQSQFDALVCFTFNLGPAVLQRSTLRRAINRGEESAVAHQWMRYVWGGGRKLPGLIHRRAVELALYRA